MAAGSDTEGLSWLRYLPAAPVSLVRSLAVALAAVAAGVALRLAFFGLLDGLPFITFFPAVAAAAVWGGWVAGLAGIALSALLVGALWLPHGSELGFWTSRMIAVTAFAVMSLIIVGMIHLLHLLLREVAARRREAGTLAAEMQHRTSNLLTLFQAMIRLTAGRAESVADFAGILGSRVEAMGRGQRLLAAGGSAEPVGLRLLAGQVLEPFDLDRFDLAGLDGDVPAAEVIMLGMVFHELATNAVKHGALTATGGRVSATSEGAEGAIEWRESGGPPATAPSRQGSGSRLLAAFAARGHALETSYEPGGLVCRIRLNAARS
jgi:two-component sensor histidine kinase